MVASPNGELYQRVESLYFSEEYKIFLITGQPLAEGGRKAYVAAKAFGEFDKETLAAMKEAAKPVGNDAALSISRGQGQIVVYDHLTRTDSFVPHSALDADVQKRLAGESNAIWNKFADAAKKQVATVAEKRAAKSTLNALMALRP